MTKQQLTELGIPDNVSDKIIESINSEFVPKAGYDEIAGEIKTLKGQIEKQRVSHKSEIAGLKLDNALNTALAMAGAKNITAAKSLINLSDISADENGSYSGISEQINSVKASDPYLFKGSETYNFVGLSPAQSSDGVPDNSDLSSMNYSELAAFLEKNPDLNL